MPEADPLKTALTHTVSQPGGDNAYDGLSVGNMAVSVGENDCGAGLFRDSDLNEDCITNFLDFAIVADPLFADSAHDDYSLKPESPAFKLGFKPIDLSRVGIRGPK